MTLSLYAVILLHSTSHTIRVEKLLRDEGIPCKMIPVPRHISSDCGACVRIWHHDMDAARHLMDDACIEVEGIQLI